MRYEIVFAPTATEELLTLRVVDQRKVLAAIELHLRYEPTKVSRSRIKRLEGIASPQYRLRIDDLRAFYDVYYETGEGVVEILAIREKSETIEWLRGKSDDPGAAESSEG